MQGASLRAPTKAPGDVFPLFREKLAARKHRYRRRAGTVRVGALLGMGGGQAVIQGVAAAAAAAQQQAHMTATGWVAAAQTAVTQWATQVLRTHTAIPLRALCPHPTARLRDAGETRQRELGRRTPAASFLNSPGMRNQRACVRSCPVAWRGPWVLFVCSCACREAWRGGGLVGRADRACSGVYDHALAHAGGGLGVHRRRAVGARGAYDGDDIYLAPSANVAGFSLSPSVCSTRPRHMQYV